MFFCESVKDGGEMIRPHRACPKCGFYKGEQKITNK